MAMKTREDALFNAYLNNYKAAQAQAVNSGVQATQAARQRGAALLNATDKTLPVLKNQLADVGTAAVAGASTEILSLVEQYKEAQQLIEAAQAEMDDLKCQITEEMTRRDVDTMDAGTHKVRYQTVTSSRLDSKGLKAAAPELAARFTKTTTSRRFSIA